MGWMTKELWFDYQQGQEILLVSIVLDQLPIHQLLAAFAESKAARVLS
jgi:hypothetical protein